MNKISLKILGLFSSMLFAVNIFASGVNYNYIELGYADGTSGSSVDLIGIQGSYEIASEIFIRAAYGFTSTPSANFTSFGLGKAIAISERTDLVLSGDFVRYDFGFPFSDESSSGALLSVGSRTMLSKRFEVNPNLSYNTESKDVSASLNGVFSLAKYFAVSGGLGFSDGDSSYSLGLRVYFPN